MRSNRRSFDPYGSSVGVSEGLVSVVGIKIYVANTNMGSALITNAIWQMAMNSHNMIYTLRIIGMMIRTCHLQRITGFQTSPYIAIFPVCGVSNTGKPRVVMMPTLSSLAPATTNLASWQLSAFIERWSNRHQWQAWHNDSSKFSMITLPVRQLDTVGLG